MNWQKASGYNERSKVEASMSRYKRVIGDTLKSRHDARRTTEVATIKATRSLSNRGQRWAPNTVLVEYGTLGFNIPEQGYRDNKYGPDFDELPWDICDKERRRNRQ